MTDVPDWTRVHDLLLTWGFPEAGRQRGGIRFGWPGQEEGRGGLFLPNDPDAPEHAELMTALLATLRLRAKQGNAADDVLSLLGDNGCPDD